VASLTGEKLVTGRCDITVQADATLAEVAEQIRLLVGSPYVVTRTGTKLSISEAFSRSFLYWSGNLFNA